MVIYNTSFMDNVTNIVDIFTGISSVTHDGTFTSYLIGYLILLSFFIIFLVMTLQNGFVEVIIVDSFLTIIIAALFMAAGLVDVVAIIIPLIIFIISLIVFLVLSSM